LQSKLYLQLARGLPAAVARAGWRDLHPERRRAFRDWSI